MKKLIQNIVDKNFSVLMIINPADNEIPKITNKTIDQVKNKTSPLENTINTTLYSYTSFFYPSLFWRSVYD